MLEPDLLLLAGQLPATSTRHELQKFLAGHWRVSNNLSENALDIVNANLVQTHLRDPGLLHSFKSLPREQPMTASELASLGRDFEIPGANRPKENDIGDLEKKSMNLWFTATEQMATGLMDRMQLAASKRSLQKSNVDELAVRLHRDAESQMIYDVRLELARQAYSGQQSSQQQVDKTTVNYVRMESPELDERIIKHYQSAVGRENVFSILNNNCMWIEYSGHDRKTQELVSIDIFIARNRARKSLVKTPWIKNEILRGERIQNRQVGSTLLGTLIPLKL